MQILPETKTKNRWHYMTQRERDISQQKETLPFHMGTGPFDIDRARWKGFLYRCIFKVMLDLAKKDDRLVTVPTTAMGRQTPAWRHFTDTIRTAFDIGIAEDIA